MTANSRAEALTPTRVLQDDPRKVAVRHTGRCQHNVAGRVVSSQALLERDHHLVRTGQVIIGDKGFAGRDFEHFITGLGAHLIRPDRKDEKPRFGNVARHRQHIEAIIDTLKGQFTLEDHGGRTMAGVYARVTTRLLAMTAAIWHNWKTEAPTKRSLIAYDQDPHGPRLGGGERRRDDVWFRTFGLSERPGYIVSLRR